MFTERHTGYPVVDTNAFEGATHRPRDADRRPRDRTGRTRRLHRRRRDDDRLQTITPDSDAMAAIDQMREHDIGRLLVVDNDDLVGLISRTDVMTAFDIVQQSGAIAPSSRPRTAD